MRLLPALMLACTLAGCSLSDSGKKTAVDTASLGPLTSREQALIYGADGAFQQGNYAAAERDYLTAVEASTGRVDAHLALARMYDKQGQREQEQVILTRALELQPNHPLANYMLGKLYLETNDFADARSAFQRGRQSRPDDLDLSIGEAVTQDMLGNHRDAQRIYSRIISTNPQAKLENVRINLGMSYLLSGDAEKAVEILKVDAKKPGASAVARHNLALAYGLLGRNTDAKTVLNGDMDEETRLLALGRLKEYLRERVDVTSPPPIQPNINQAPLEAEDVPTTKPAPVINKATKPAVKKPAAAKP